MMDTPGFNTDDAVADEVAKAFHADGYVVLRNVLGKELVSRLHDAAMANFTECLDLIKSKGLEFGLHSSKGFKEIVQRNAGRYEMPFGMDDTDIFKSPEILQNEKLNAILDAILRDHKPAAEPTDTVEKDPVPENDASSPSPPPPPSPASWHRIGWSIVVASPGAREQQWHVDGAHVDVTVHRPAHVLNVFLPLVDITEENGPTEVRPGSHYLSRDLTRLTLLAKVKKTLRAPVRPCPRAGDALVFDYRSLHRGRANSCHTTRPVLVLTFAKKWFRDLYNFPKRSLHDHDGDGDGDGKAAAAAAAAAAADRGVVCLATATTTAATTAAASNPPAPLVSVIVPTRGTKPEALSRAIASVWAQQQPTQEKSAAALFRVEVVLCIDPPAALSISGGGGGGGSCLLDKHLPLHLLPSSPLPPSSSCSFGSWSAVFEDPRLRVVRLPEWSGGRPGRVRNAGLDALAEDTEWVAFLDDDDVWLSGKLHAQLSRMAADKTNMSCTGAVEDHAHGQQQQQQQQHASSSSSLLTPPPSPLLTRSATTAAAAAAAAGGNRGKGDSPSPPSAATSTLTSVSTTSVPTPPAPLRLTPPLPPTMPRGACALPPVLTLVDLERTNVVVTSSVVLHKKRLLDVVVLGRRRQQSPTRAEGGGEGGEGGSGAATATASRSSSGPGGSEGAGGASVGSGANLGTGCESESDGRDDGCSGGGRGFGDAKYGQDYAFWKRCLDSAHVAEGAEEEKTEKEEVAVKGEEGQVTDRTESTTFPEAAAPPAVEEEEKEEEATARETTAATTKPSVAATASAYSGGADGIPRRSHRSSGLVAGRCSFLNRALVVYGTGGADRSTARKETRQAVQHLVETGFQLAQTPLLQLHQPPQHQPPQRQCFQQKSNAPGNTPLLTSEKTAKQISSGGAGRLSDLIQGFAGL